MEKYKPIFSVIVPIYKVEDYLRVCVESVLSQSFPYFQLILVDDGSPDECGIICDEYLNRDDRVVVIHKNNGGLVSARKAGASIAEGEYVLCLDGDDWLEKDCLLFLSDILKLNCVDVICFGYNSIFKDKTTNNCFHSFAGKYNKDEIEKLIFPSLIQKENCTYFPPSLWGKCFRRELYREEQMKIDDKISIGEDGACSIPIIYKAESLYILNKCLYNYRQSDESITKGKKAYCFTFPRLVSEHLKRNIDLNSFDFLEQYYRKIVHDLFTVAVSQFYRKEKYRIIVKEIKKELSDPVFLLAVRKAKFKNSTKAVAMHISLKYRLFFLIKLFSKLKKV